MYIELAYATTGHKMTLINTVGKTAVLRDGSGTILFGSGIAADCNAEGTYPCQKSYLRVHEWDMAKQWCGLKTYALAKSDFSKRVLDVFIAYHPLECDA